MLLTLGLLAGCPEEDDSAPPVASTQGDDGPSSSSGSTNTNATMSATLTSSSGAAPNSSSSDSGPSEACRGCWAGACADEVEACFGDDACTCRFSCDSDGTCVMKCPQSDLFNDLLGCIVEASIGPCVVPCEAECAACFVTECMAEFEACGEDDTCLCHVWCDNGGDCDSLCGPATPAFDALGACFGAAGEACPGPC